MTTERLSICTECHEREGDSPQLRHLVILVTERCNSRCRHCGYGGSALSQAMEMPTETILGLISEAAAMGCDRIILSGGEPMLRNDIVELFRHTCSLGIDSTCALCTNGSLIDREKAVQLASANPSGRVVLSLDGHTEELHDAIRGFPGSFRRVLAAVDYLKEAFGNTGHIGINTVINSDNVAQAERIIDVVAGLGIRSHKLVPVYSRCAAESHALSDHELAGLFHRAKHLRKRAEHHHIELVNLSPYARVETAGCHVPSFLSFVDSRGRIYGCNLAKTGFQVSEAPPLGIYKREGDLATCWTSEAYRTFRDKARLKLHAFCEPACPDITAHTMNFLHGPCGSCINQVSLS